MSRIGWTLLVAGFLAVGACGVEPVWAQDAGDKGKSAGELMAGDTSIYKVGTKVFYTTGVSYRVGTIESIAQGKAVIKDEHFKERETVPMEWLMPYLNLKVGENVCWIDAFGAFKTGEVAKVNGEQITVKLKEAQSEGDPSAPPMPPGIPGAPAAPKGANETKRRAGAKMNQAGREVWVNLEVIFRGEKLPANRYASVAEVELGTRVVYFGSFMEVGTGKVVGIDTTFNNVKIKDDKSGSEVSVKVVDVRNLDVDMKTGAPVAGAAGEPGVKKAVWGKVQEITLRGGAKGGESFTPGPAKAVPKLKEAVALGKAAGASVRGVVDVVGPQRSVAVVDYAGDSGVWYSLVDMASGQAKGPILLEPGKRIIAASPDGTRLACDTGEAISVWKIDGEQPQKLVSFKAQHVSADKWEQMDRLFFINNDRLVAICGDKRYVGWDISGVPTAVWAADTGMMNSVGDVDPARTAVIVPNHWESQVLDPLTGEVKATISTRPAWESAHFSPSGKRIHARFQKEYVVLDLTNPASRAKYFLQDLQWGNGEAPHWLGSETTLLGQDKVFNTRLGVYTGTFGKGAWPFVTPDGRLVTVSKKGDSKYYLTDEMAQSPEMLSASSKVKPEQTMYYKPGDAVSIQVNVTGIDKGDQRAKTRLMEQLKAQGVEVAEGRPVKIVVSVLDLPKSRLKVDTGSDAGKEIAYTPVEYKIEVFSQGQSVWKQSQEYRGPMGFKKKDQSWDDFIAAGRKEYEKFVDQFEVPRGVPKAEKELEGLWK
jgi:hypothetical protein